MSDVRGEVVTFYSYKGGTGRSMALANIACLLAQRGDTVLVVDWDLEAPGLHRYFEPFLHRRDAELPGLIDLFYDARVGALDAAEIDLRRYIRSTKLPRLYFMPAGRFDDDYAKRINTFSWTSFFEETPSFFRELAQRLASRARYVLIDSRTGHTDISSICTTLMPEKLIVVFTPNRQSLTGVADLVTRATEYRRASDDVRGLTVFPLPSRIDTNYPDLMTSWRDGEEGWQREFQSLLRTAYELDEPEAIRLEPYFDAVQVFHVGQYAFGEPIFVLDQRTTDKSKVASSYSALIGYLDRGAPWNPEEAVSHTVATPGTPVLRGAPRAFLRTPWGLSFRLFLAVLLLLFFGAVLAFFFRGSSDRESTALLARVRSLDLGKVPPSTAALLLVEALPGLGGTERQLAESSLATVLRGIPRRLIHWESPAYSPDAAFSSNGEWLVAYGNGYGNYRMSLWYVSTGEKSAEWNADARNAQFNDAAGGIVTYGGSRLSVWRAEQQIANVNIRPLLSDEGRTLVTLSPDGEFVVISDKKLFAPDGAVRFWRTKDLLSSAPTLPLPLFQVPSGDFVPRIEFAAEARICAIWRRDTVTLCHYADQKVLKTFDRPDGGAGVLSRDGNLLAVTDESGFAVYRWSSGDIASVVAADVRDIAFSPDVMHVATLLDDGTLRLWDLATLDVVGTGLFRSQGANAKTLVGLSDGRFALLFPREVMIVSANLKDAHMRIETTGEVVSVVESPNAPRLAVLSTGAVSVYDISSAQRLPNDLVTATCARVRRPLSREEWATFLPQRKYDPQCAAKALSVD